MIDTVRVAELNNELGVVQDQIQRAEQRAGEIIVELRELLTEQPGQATPVVELPAADRVGTPAPAPSQIDCPECGEPVTARGLGVHRARSKAHAAAVNAKARQVVGLPVVTRRPPPAERNPRSAPPLDLPPRLDQAVGE